MEQGNSRKEQQILLLTFSGFAWVLISLIEIYPSATDRTFQVKERHWVKNI